MSSSRAPDGYSQVSPSLAQVPGEEVLQEGSQVQKELACTFRMLHKSANLRIPAVLVPQILHKVGVIQKPHVKDNVGFLGQAVLETERNKGQKHLFPAAGDTETVAHELAKIVIAQIGSVQVNIGRFPERF